MIGVPPDSYARRGWAKDHISDSPGALWVPSYAVWVDWGTSHISRHYEPNFSHLVEKRGFSIHWRYYNLLCHHGRTPKFGQTSVSNAEGSSIESKVLYVQICLMQTSLFRAWDQCRGSAHRQQQGCNYSKMEGAPECERMWTFLGMVGYYRRFIQNLGTISGSIRPSILINISTCINSFILARLLISYYSIRLSTIATNGPSAFTYY